MTSRELEQRLQQLESILKEKDEQYNRLMVDSRRALDLALHAYKVDHYGYIWTYSPDDGLYHKTNMRVATPEIADRAIQTRHLVSKCVTSEKIADKAVTRDKLTDEVINELRMVDIQNLYFGDYYTKEEVEELLKDVDVDLSEYYKKNETYSAAEIRRMVAGLNPDLSGYYTKDDVDRMLRAIRNGRFVPVSALPTASADTLNAIYLVPRGSEESEEGNIKDEFITISSGSGENITYSWEKIGSTDIDLSGYAKTSQLFSGDYNDLRNKPEIPEGVDISGKADKVPTTDSQGNPLKDENQQNIVFDGQLVELDAAGNIRRSNKKASDISWNNLKPSGGITLGDLEASLKNTINSMPSDAAVGGKVDKVDLPQGVDSLEDVIPTLAAAGNNKYGIKSSGKKISDLIGKITIEPFSNTKSYAVGDFCTKGVAPNVVITWKCTTAHEGDWNDQHFADMTDHLLTIGLDGRIEDSGKKVSELLTEQAQADWNQSVSSKPDYIKNKPTIPDVSGKADKIGVPFDANAAYAVDSYVTKDGDLYKCTTAHQGAWLAADFVKVTGNMLTVDGNGNIKDSGKAPFSGSYNDLNNKPTIPDVSIYAKKSETAVKIGIESGTSSVLNVVAGKLYRYNDVVNTALIINLPVLTEEAAAYVQTAIICLTTGTSNPNITFRYNNDTDGVLFYEGLSFEPETKYEINCMWNGANWVVSYGIIA